MPVEQMERKRAIVWFAPLLLGKRGHRQYSKKTGSVLLDLSVFFRYDQGSVDCIATKDRIDQLWTMRLHDCAPLRVNKAAYFEVDSSSVVSRRSADLECEFQSKAGTGTIVVHFVRGFLPRRIKGELLILQEGEMRAEIEMIENCYEPVSVRQQALPPQFSGSYSRISPLRQTNSRP